MKRLICLLFLSLFFALPLHADEEKASYLEEYFRPMAIDAGDDSNTPLTKEAWASMLERYATYRKLPLKEITPSEHKLTLAEAKAIYTRHIKNAKPLTLPYHFKEKGSLSKKDGLILLRKIDASLGHVDILVYGSEVESVSAALSAKKEGMEVALIHEKPKLGGLAIDGNLNYIDLPQSDGIWLMQGFAKTFQETLGNGYDFDKARHFLLYELKKSGVIISPSQKTLHLEKSADERITSVATKGVTFYPKIVIDASENGDLMSMAGAKFTNGLYEDSLCYPACSLLYTLDGVDYKKVTRFLNTRQKKEGTFEGGLNRIAWGYAKEMKGYQPLDKNNAVRGLNIAYIKETNQTVINHLFHTNTNPLDEKSKQEAMDSLKKETKRLVPYLRSHLVGFENAKLSHFASELYLRDSRHFIGKYRLTLTDIINRTAFDDKVLITNYPVDIHATKERKENLILYKPQSYEIPYRVMVDDTHPNLLVTSKCASYEPVAAGSARIIMTGTMMSEVGGLAGSLAILTKKDVQEIDITTLQEKLYRRGFLKDHPAPLKRTLLKDEIAVLQSGKMTYEELQHSSFYVKRLLIN